jgi:hypothetical protein
MYASYTFHCPSALERILAGKRESFAKFETPQPLAYNAENGQFGPLLKVECRGLEFTDFDPMVSGKSCFWTMSLISIWR